MANDLHDLRDGLLPVPPAGVRTQAAVKPAFARADVRAPAATTDAWPVEPADIWVVERGRPVGLCTLGDPELARLAAAGRWEQLAVAGPLATENLGIEKLVRNVLAAPWLRFIVMAGPETGGTAPTGHYAADALSALHARGVDAASMRIVGARGRRPILRNLTVAEVDRFRAAVVVVDHRGEERVEAIRAAVVGAAEHSSGYAVGPPTAQSSGRLIYEESAAELRHQLGYRPDPAGYFLVFVDRGRGCLVLEHYTNQGVRTAMLSGDDPRMLASLARGQQLISRPDHAAYLERELRRAGDALRAGAAYVQDATP